MVGDVGFENSEGMGEAPDSVMVSDVLAALSTRTWNVSVGPLLMFRRAAYTKMWAGEERLTSTWYLSGTEAALTEVAAVMLIALSEEQIVKVVSNGSGSLLIPVSKIKIN
jgi:hypothetical protein